jgi:hypothetical protein
MANDDDYDCHVDEALFEFFKKEVYISPFVLLLQKGVRLMYLFLWGLNTLKASFNFT